jgi:hypothetical protein
LARAINEQVGDSKLGSCLPGCMAGTHPETTVVQVFVQNPAKSR